MSNWVTLSNGVHIDLDDPNNPITGDGSFESYLGGGDKSGPTLLRVAGSVSEKFIRDKAEKHGLKVEVLRVGNEMRVSVAGGAKLNDLVNDFDEDGVLIEYPKNNKSKSTNKLSDISKMTKEQRRERAKELSYTDDEIFDVVDQFKDKGYATTTNPDLAELYNMNLNSEQNYTVTDMGGGKFKIESNTTAKSTKSSNRFTHQQTREIQELSEKYIDKDRNMTAYNISQQIKTFMRQGDSYEQAKAQIIKWATKK